MPSAAPQPCLSSIERCRPVALRPTLSGDLPLSGSYDCKPYSNFGAIKIQKIIFLLTKSTILIYQLILFDFLKWWITIKRISSRWAGYNEVHWHKGGRRYLCTIEYLFHFHSPLVHACSRPQRLVFRCSRDFISSALQRFRL